MRVSYIPRRAIYRKRSFQCQENQGCICRTYPVMLFNVVMGIILMYLRPLFVFCNQFQFSDEFRASQLPACSRVSLYLALISSKKKLRDQVYYLSYYLIKESKGSAPNGTYLITKMAARRTGLRSGTHYKEAPELTVNMLQWIPARRPE